MAISVGSGRVSETPEQFIKQYVDWLKSEAGKTPGTSYPPSIGFVMVQSIPYLYGPGVVVVDAGFVSEQPETIYSEGNLYLLGNASLGGNGFARSNRDGFGKTTSVSVRLDPPDKLSVNADTMIVTLHHDVLFGSARTPVESTSPGSVATLMLWGVPAQPVG